MRKALVVGLNDYEGHELEWCDNDAAAIKALIESNGDGSPNFDVVSIIGGCTKNQLHEAIKELFFDDAETALLYFSGHGSDNDGGYLCTSDFSDGDLGVRMERILQLANESKCKNKVIILDCCFAGKLGESVLVNNQSVLGNGVTIMAASQSWQPSKERSQIQHGVFTNLLIQGLKGGAADIRGNITPASLYTFVDQSLGAWDQRPVFKTNISNFSALRTIPPRISESTLRKISVYFEESTDEFKLDPSYECTNTPEDIHELIEPYADPDHIKIFKDLQSFERIGLVEPVGTEHMYFAAMKRKSCKLTALGAHYWRLSKNKRF